MTIDDVLRQPVDVPDDGFTTRVMDGLERHLRQRRRILAAATAAGLAIAVLTLTRLGALPDIPALTLDLDAIRGFATAHGLLLLPLAIMAWTWLTAEAG